MYAKEIFKKTSAELSEFYEIKEAESLAYWLLKDVWGVAKIDILVNREIVKPLPEYWNDYLQRLKNYEPVQYVVGQTEFCNLMFEVNPDVLIPRPETEELMYLIADQYRNVEREINILDIGTGSGCIAISLASMLPQAHVRAWDISVGALATAKRNAQRNGVKVIFEEVNILETQTQTVQQFDVVVSNPPYVKASEAQTMLPNVLDHEPHLALFVPDDDPLIFYKHIAQKSKQMLVSGGLCAVEINQALGSETAEVFQKEGFTNIRITKDFFEKDRYVLAWT
jgi:release factor glutamine methyltransferase